MSEAIINPAVEAQKKAALNMPHNLIMIDQLLKANSDGYQVHVTVGWETPQGSLMPAGTLIMPLPFATELANALTKAVHDGNKKRDK
jgi:hypothetical protein